MVRVYQAQHGAEAHLVRTLLEAEGILAVVQGESLRMGVGEVPFTAAYPTVHVREEDAQAAADVVAQFQAERDQTPEGEPWVCPTCGEMIEPQFAQCWRCADRQAHELFLYGHGDCPLCDRLEAIVRPLIADSNVTFTKRDITTHRDWMRAYRDRIPVLTDAVGHVLVEGRPEADAVAAALRALAD